MKDSGKTLNGKKFEYEILEFGYKIYLDGKKFFKWRSVDKLDPDAYEKMALDKIEFFSQIPSESEPTEEEKNRADIDYIAAITGITL